MTTIAVLGSGIMASALSVPLTDNGHEVRLVGTHLDREIIDNVKSSRVHPNLDLQLPEGVSGYQLEEAEAAFDGAEVVLSGVNSFGVEWAGEQLARLLEPGQLLIAIAKGMQASDEGDLRILPEVLVEQLGDQLRAEIPGRCARWSTCSAGAARRPTASPPSGTATSRAPAGAT